MGKKTEALKLALGYVTEALEHHDSCYNRHPATEAERNMIVEDLNFIREALAEQPANVATVNTSEELVDKTAENVHEQPAQGCDYCNHPQYAGTKCKNCGREQPAQQEPVAHCRVRPLRGDQSFPTVEVDWVSRPVPGPLYTSPPASKPWVGLTDEDLQCFDADAVNTARYWEAKLREKNA